jgi:hypothetical protein
MNVSSDVKKHVFLAVKYFMKYFSFLCVLFEIFEIFENAYFRQMQSLNYEKKSPKQSTIITFECRNNILLNYVLLYLRMLNLFSTNDTQYYYKNSITAENLENRLPLCSLFTTMVDRYTPPHFVLLYK